MISVQKCRLQLLRDSCFENFCSYISSKLYHDRITVNRQFCPEKMSAKYHSFRILQLLNPDLTILRVQCPRFYSNVAQMPVNYYKILGVPSKSTQGEIKAAYYKLSKKYHPDVNMESEEAAIDAADNFRKISAAYEILGNLKLRKLYDRGLLPTDQSFQQTADQNDEEGPSEFQKNSKYRRTRSQPSSGRTGVYDFDEWSRFHYGNAMNRRNEAKEKHRSGDAVREKIHKEKETEYVVIGAVLLSCFVLLGLSATTNTQYDNVTTKEKRL